MLGMRAWSAILSEVHQFAGTLQNCNFFPERQRKAAADNPAKLLAAAKKNLAKSTATTAGCGAR